MAIQIPKDHLFEKGTPFNPRHHFPINITICGVYSIVRPSHMQERL